MYKGSAVSSEDSYNLSSEQKDFYHKNGYLVLNQFIDFASLYAYKKRFVQICNGIVPKGNMTIVKEKNLMAKSSKAEDYVNKVQDILYDDVLGLYMESPKLLDAVCQLVGPELTAMHSMLINKPPGTGEHPPHQDLYYFPFRPASQIVAAWTAIDAATKDNGCLYVLPGSHKMETLYEHDSSKDNNKMYHGIVDPTVCPAERRVYLEMGPGDTVLFHPYLVHGSGANTTESYRKSISCHFANSGVRFVEVDPKQEKIAREVEAEGARRGFDLTFQEIWQLRSKVVRSAKSKL